ncbi:MAG TPA: type III-B CRISPR module RAMP protein Cmr4 [Herpetosiphon sp.]|uniref:CRISPR-associated RAMP protein, Cmr4 family n=1 Tax=Herpetosiphon aurantiacus (strain ATCC 23779 / DSM 785 / 114-95) TaxID=316274 RepID=A9AVY6_HERA2|nr:type III-B CRISPR module RAMP protein Cmr4 [Herpetosiphon sp.]ABX03224.1 CRISPR-associated RAMP protein, Cmr4 family [Herpetosiphon aurantiacus DSM 785]HBW52519.1 type III-B CRISPR module RAMP protein Cmr4 [Herpetosiphon sp.]
MQTHVIFVHALSPIHAGTGQSVDVIDLPIAREKATNLPYIPGSSIKGVIRDVSPASESLKKQLFGDVEQAGDAIFADQRLLLLPIRSLYGTFAWVTSPYVLSRFAREAQTSNLWLPEIKRSELALISQNSVLSYQQKVYLEDLDLEATPGADAWAGWLAKQLFPDKPDWQTILQERLCIVPDEIFNFLVTTATEITARIRLDDNTKVVTKGGLWYEEALPAETILAGIVAINDQKRSANRDQVITAIIEVANQGIIQLGGNATVGCGLCQLTIAQGDR